MKKIYFLLSFVLSTTIMLGQYFIGSAVNAGYNPGMLNTDIEGNSTVVLPLGWNSILSSTSTDQWSATQTIPFTFEFNGATVSNYKVSNTGVLTFSTSASAVPSSSNQPLPSVSIPDKSVMVWGLDLSGNNDMIVTKTFGIAPVRQHWIQFNSASAGSLPSSGSTYWSIVLEEGTNSIYIVDHRTDGGNLSLTGGIQIDATTAIMISSALNSETTSGSTSDDASDNTFYEFGTGVVQPLYDIAGVGTDVPKIVKTGTLMFINGTFWNKGDVPAGGYKVNYKINNGATVSAPMTTVINTYGTASLNHPIAFEPTADGVYNVEMWIDSINGGLDEKPANDILKFAFTALTNAPVRNVLIEEGTGTWCQWCPRGMVAIDYMAANFPKAIVISVHNAGAGNTDPMALTDYDDALDLSGYPSSRVDRGDEVDPNSSVWEAQYNSRVQVAPEATVSIDGVWYDKAGGKFVADMSAHFVIPSSNSDYRFAIVLTEDDVTGTTSGYAQVNAYAGGGQGPMGGYENLPNPVPANMMKYDRVARAIEPGFKGEPGSVPANLSANQHVTHKMIFNDPGNIQDVDQVYVVAMLLDNQTGRVVNSDVSRLIWSIGLESYKNHRFSLYPNPTAEGFTLESTKGVEYEVYDVSGRMIAKGATIKDHTEIKTNDWNSGIYTIKLISAGYVEMQKITVAR